MTKLNSKGIEHKEGGKYKEGAKFVLFCLKTDSNCC